jgi:glutathione S-transferase
VRRVLVDQQIPHSVVEIDPYDRSEVIRLSGQQGVPIIIDEQRDGEIVVDSAVILDYLDRHYPPASV